MKPTHLIKTIKGDYWVNYDSDDVEIMRNLIGCTNGNVRLVHLQEDPNWQSEKRYLEKLAIVSCRHLVSIEEV